MRSRSYILIGGVLGLLVGLMLFVLLRPRQAGSFQGSLIEPAQPIADFQLTDQFGQPFRLADQRGKIVMLYFGYTHCPDFCPATLAVFRQVRAGLGEQADQVVFALATVDPQRDTVEVLQTYLQGFDSSFVGLTGSEAELEPVWQSFGVYRKQVATTEHGSGASHGSDPNDYAMDHTTRTYLVDAEGNLLLTYAYGFEPDRIREDLLRLLAAAP